MFSRNDSGDALGLGDLVDLAGRVGVAGGELHGRPDGVIGLCGDAHREILYERTADGFATGPALPRSAPRVTPHRPHGWAAWQAQLGGDAEAVTGVEVDVAFLGGLEVGADPIGIALLEHGPEHG